MITSILFFLWAQLQLHGGYWHKHMHFKILFKNSTLKNLKRAALIDIHVYCDIQ